jgi:hypothetical protein
MAMTTRMSWIRAIPALAALGLVACGGRVFVDDAPDGGGSDTEGGAGHEAGDAGKAAEAGTDGSFTASQVQAALAQCNLPHGLSVAVPSVASEDGLLAGAWLLCGSGPVATVFSPGIVLSPGGAFARLASTSDGGLAAASGLDNQGTWTASCEESSSISGTQPCPGVVVSIRGSTDDVGPEACFGGPINFESSPTRMYAVDDPSEWCDVSSTLGTFDLWLVPLPAN